MNVIGDPVFPNILVKLTSACRHVPNALIRVVDGSAECERRRDRLNFDLRMAVPKEPIDLYRSTGSRQIVLAMDMAAVVNARGANGLRWICA